MQQANTKTHGRLAAALRCSLSQLYLNISVSVCCTAVWNGKRVGNGFRLPRGGRYCLHGGVRERQRANVLGLDYRRGDFGVKLNFVF